MSEHILNLFIADGVTLGLVSVYIIDDHEQVRFALADRLGRVATIQVIGHTGNQRNILPDMNEFQPDVVLLEIKRRDGMGLQIIRQLASLPSSPRIVVLTSYAHSSEKKAAFQAGADHYFLKDIETDQLTKQIASY